MVRKTWLAIVATSLALAMAGCGPAESDPPPGDGSGNAADDPPLVSATGIAPIVVGAAADALKGSGAVGALADVPGCPGWATADAGGSLAGRVTATFHNGALTWVEIRSTQLSTVDGATLGMSAGELKGIYSGQTADLSDGHGGSAVGVAQDGDTGYLFRIDGDNIAAIEAGSYTALRSRFAQGKDC